MTKTDIRRALKKPSTYVGIGIVLVVAVAIITSFVVVTHKAAAPAVSAVSESDSETAYENIIKDSLNVYKVRYSHYPDSYQTLLDDITASPATYGVNDQGLSDLSAISGHLSGFTYTSDTSSYQFTYQKGDTGKTATVKSN